MNEEYLQGLYNYLNIEDTFDNWRDSIVDNEEYLRGLHGYLKIEDTFDNWNNEVFGSTTLNAVEVEEPEVVSQEASFDSPYLKDRKFGEFVTGRSMPVEVEDLSVEERELSNKIISDIEKEENKSNKNLTELQSYNYIPLPGSEYFFKSPELGLDNNVQPLVLLDDQNLPIYNYNPSYLDNRYASMLNKDTDGNFQMLDSTGKKENFRAEWFTTDEGQSWVEQNWFKEDDPQLGIKNEEINNYVQTGVSRGGEINSTKALNNEIGTILNNDNVKYPLPEGFTLDPGVVDQAEENVNLKNAEVLSDFYGNKSVGQAGFHQREIIRLSSQNDLLNPNDFGFGENFKKNLEKIKYHENEINNLRKDYFANQYDEDGTPTQWYDLLSGEMVKKSQATSTQLTNENRDIANASKKWGDTNVEVLYKKENKLINEVVYLAKKAQENPGLVKSGTTFASLEKLTEKQQKAFEKQANSNFLVPGLSTLPGKSKIANEFNTKLAELVQIQKAIVLNYKPTDLKKTDTFVDYIGQVIPALAQQANPFKISSGILSENVRIPSGVFTDTPDNLAVDKDIEKAKEALTFIKFTEDQVGKEKTEELAEYWDPGFDKGSAQAIMEGVKIAVEFGITRKIAGGTVKKAVSEFSKIGKYLLGESRIANALNTTVATIVEEAALIEVNNKLIRENIGEERFDPRFAIGLGVGGTIVKGSSNALIKSQTYRNLITTLNEAPVFESLVRGTVQPTVSSFTILAGSLGEISLQKNQSLKKSFDDLTAEDGFLQHMFSTFIMVKSAGLANPVKGITNVLSAAEQSIIARKGGLNKRANEASKVLDLKEELRQTNKDGTKPLNEKQIDEKAFNIMRQEGLFKELLTEEQQARKKQIREAAGTLKTQIDFNNIVKEINSTYGRSEYANIFTLGRRLQSGQSPTAAQALTLSNMASLDQVFSIIKDPNGSFSENKRQEKVFVEYVQQVKSFVEGIRKTGGTANDPKKEIKLLEKWNQYNELILAPLTNLNTYLDNNEVEGPERSEIEKQISKLEIKQQEYFDQLNLELQEFTAERRKKQRQKVRNIIGKQDKIKYTKLNDIEFAEKFGEKNTEGLFINESGEIFVNETYANEINSVSVDSHEVLHPAMNVTLNKLAAEGRLNPFITDFKKSLPANVLAEAQRIIDERTDITDKEFTREWFNVVSDVLQSGRIKTVNTRSSMQKLADTFTEFFKAETPMEDVDFETGVEAFEFIKRFSENFREGQSDAQLEEAVVSKLKRFETSEGTEKSSTPKVDEKTGNIFLDLTVKKNQVTLDDIIGERNKEGYYKMPKSKWKNSEAETLSIKLINGGSFDKLIGAKIFSQIKGQKRQNLLEGTQEELKKHVRAFDPQLNKNLFGYINSYLGLKVGTASKTKSIETSSLDQRQELMGREGSEIASSDMSAEDLTDISLEKDRRAKSEEQKPKETTASKIGMPKEVKTPSGKVESNEYVEKVVSEINFKDLKDITTEPGPNQTVSPFLSNLKAKVATDGNVKKDISQGMGRAKERASYLETNFEKLAKSLDPTYFSGLIEREISKGKKATLPKGLIQKDIGSGYTSNWYGKKAVGTKAAKTGITSGLKRIRLNPDFNFKNKANAKIFADAFKSQGRYEGLAGQIGAKAVIDLVEKSLGTGNKIDTKIKDIYEIQGRDLPADYAKNFKDQILRAGIERSSTKKPEEIKLKSKIKKVQDKVAKTRVAKEKQGINADIERAYGGSLDHSNPNDFTKLNYNVINVFAPKLGVDIFSYTTAQTMAAAGRNAFGSKPSTGAVGAKFWYVSDIGKVTDVQKLGETTSMIEAGYIGDLTELNNAIAKKLNLKIPTPKNRNLLAKSQSLNNLKYNKENLKELNKEKRRINNKWKEIYDKYPEARPSIKELQYNNNANAAVSKNEAFVLDFMEGATEFNKYEEHGYQHGEYSLDKARAMSSKVPGNWENWNNLADKEYKQMVFNKTTKMLSIKGDMRTYQGIVDLTYNIPGYGKVKFKSQKHPLVSEMMDIAFKSGKKSDWAKVPPVSDMRYFNEVIKLNPFILKTFVNGKTITFAEKYNLEVPKELQSNPNIYQAVSDLILDINRTRAGKLKGDYKITSKEAQEILDKIIKVEGTKEFELAKKENVKNLESSNVLDLKNAKDITTENVIEKARTIDKALTIARSSTAPIKKIRVFDFDDTIARTKSKVFAERGEEKIILTAEEFAKRGSELIDQGYEMDFSDFNKVVEGKKGPLFDLIKKMKEAKGERDIFILTARAPESQLAIFEFMKAMGVEIPLENITGLGKSDGKAKADWIVGKAAEGYNDFYFADDAVSNVKAVKKAMSKLDVKSKVQLAKENKINFSEKKTKDLDWKTDKAGNIKTTFEIAGKKYNFNLDARDSKGSFDVEFNLDGRIDITGTGNAIRVIRTVYNGLLDAVNKNPKIKRLEFSSLKSEQSRVKLYTTLMDKVAKKLGWETDIWESNNFITPEKSSYDFEITKPRKKQVAPVEKVLDVIDVKSNTQVAKIERSSTMSQDFNKIIEESTGIGAEKVFSDVKAQVRGAKAKRQRFFIPPSAEDMLGLVYTTLGKGKKGEAHLKFYQENLFDPYTRAMENLSTDRVNLMADFKALKKQLDVPKDLRKTTESGFTNEQAVRVYLWNKMGEKIPGLSKSDLKELNDIVENNPKLKVFADQILSITKGDGYSKPKDSWAVGTITTDLIDVLNTKKRSKYLETWKQNKNLIYSKENLNKLEAAYGPKYRAALENSLRRMESGSNRLGGGNRLSNQVLDYINNSTGAIMFFNARSAVLQTISAANFINWGFNNPYKAGKAFANQPQYWKDFVELMNSDYLKDRRNGLKLNINESEIANAAKTSGNKAKAALNYILEKGYLPTKYADSFAIASGGATFYRNRINDLIKNEGKTEAEAKEIAMKEFRQVSEMSQQSSDPSKISQQQSSDLGRVVLQFANTPMQYARIQKRAVQDIVNGRGDLKTNISKIAYYGFLQNMLFNGLQQAVTSLGFGDEEMTDAEEKKLIKAANGMLDSSLRGLGMAGVTAQVLKNLGIDIYDRSKRDRPEFTDSYKKLLEFSPAIKSKLGKFQSAAYPFDSKKRRAEVFEKGFSLDNPAYESMAKVITGTTNLPLDRLYSKVNNLSAAMDEETETWQSIAMILGWPEWQIKGKQNYVEASSKRKNTSSFGGSSFSGSSF